MSSNDKSAFKTHCIEPHYNQRNGLVMFSYKLVKYDWLFFIGVTLSTRYDFIEKSGETILVVFEEADSRFEVQNIIKSKLILFRSFSHRFYH